MSKPELPARGQVPATAAGPDGNAPAVAPLQGEPRPKPRTLQGQVLLEAIAELCDRKQSFILTTPYHTFPSRFIEMDGQDVLVRASMSQSVVQGVLNNYPLYMRFPWDLTTYGGSTRVLDYEAGEKTRNLRVLLPPAVTLDNTRGAYRVERVGRSTGAISSPELNLVRITLENISTNGAAVFCLEPLPPGAFQYGRLVDLSISLEQGPQLQAKGRICHLDGQAMGICFNPPLAGRALEDLSGWIQPRMEEDQRRWDNRMALRAISERNAQAREAPQGVLLVGSDEAALGVVERALGPDLPVRTVPAALAPFKEAISFHPPHLLIVVGSGLADETHRLRVMLEAVPPACPVVVIGTGAGLERVRTLAGEVRAARFMDLKVVHPVIFLKLVQGLIRRHWDPERP